MNIEQIKSGIEARKVEIVKLELQLETAEAVESLRVRAVANCIEIYTNFDEEELPGFPRAMRMAWETGEKLNELGILKVRN